MLRVKGALLAVLLTLAAAACARTQAKTVPEPPPLDVPPAPPRVVQPVPGVDEGIAQPSEPGTAAQAPARRPPTRPETPRPELPKPEPVKRDPAKGETPPDPSKTVGQPDVPRAATLETAPPGGPAEVQRTVRNQITKARGDLDHVNYKVLNADGKSQYDAAKRFIEQAEQALKDGNLLYAAKLADKAATLASLLLGR
jgi:hypothetical protein